MGISMSKYTEWIEDVLDAAKQTQSPEAVKIIENCGKGCAVRQNAEEGILKLREMALNCKTRADYVAFLNGVMPIHITEAEDGIVMHLGKEKCSCPMISELSSNTDMLCECTRGHEKAVWSAFFGITVEVEIVESHLRGGTDCVIKILI